MIIYNGVIFDGMHTYADVLKSFRKLRMDLMVESQNIWNEYIISECVLHYDLANHAGTPVNFYIKDSSALYENNLRNSFLENKPSELNLGAVCYVAQHKNQMYGLLECSNSAIRMFIIKHLGLSEFILDAESVSCGDISQEMYDERGLIWNSILDGKYPNDRMFGFELSYTSPRVLEESIMEKYIPTDDIRADCLCVTVHGEIVVDKVQELKAGLQPVTVQDFIDRSNE